MIRKIDERACIGCSVCEMICPGDVIVMDAENKATPIINADTSFLFLIKANWNEFLKFDNDNNSFKFL